MFAALSFLTTLGRPTQPSPRAFLWFPVVGAGIGGLVGVVWWGAGEVWPPLVAAAVALGVDLALTGLLHVDGLADAADGLLAPADRERRLEIMRDPHVGAFGVVTVVAVLLLRWSALASMTPEPLLLVGLWAGSRAAMAAVPAVLIYARTDGLATGFLAGEPSLLPAVAVVPAVAVAAVARGWAGALAMGALLVAFAAVTALAQRRVGGFTGDVLGAAAVVGETVGLVAASA